MDKNHKKASHFPKTPKASQNKFVAHLIHSHLVIKTWLQFFMTQIILHKIKTCTAFDLIQLFYYYVYFSMIENVNKKIENQT